MMSVTQNPTLPMPNADFLTMDMAPSPDIPTDFAALLAKLDLVSTTGVRSVAATATLADTAAPSTAPETDAQPMDSAPPVVDFTGAKAGAPAPVPASQPGVKAIIPATAQPTESMLMRTSPVVAAAASAATELPATELLALLLPHVESGGERARPVSTVPNLILPRYPGVPLAAEPAARASSADALPDQIEEDEGSVPAGLEGLADALASALAGVMAAVTKTLEASPGGTQPAPMDKTPPATIAASIPVQASGGPTIADSIPFKIISIAPPGAPDPVQAPIQATTESDVRPVALSRSRTSSAPPALDLPDAGISSVTPVAPATVQATATPPSSVTGAPPALAVGPGELIFNHHLDLARDGEWLDQLARDIVRTASHDTQLRFQLNPEHLGSLSVEIANRADGTAIRLTADTEAARTILTDAQPRLIAEARAQGLRISEAQVDLGGSSGQTGQHQRHQPSSEATLIRTQQSHDEPAAEATRGSDERYA